MQNYNINLFQNMDVQQNQSDIIDIYKLSQHQKDYFCPNCHSHNYYRFKFTNVILHPLTYQKMSERGWARNGLCYMNPISDKTCCKNWQIKLDCNEFKPNKKQMKILKKNINIFNDPEQVTNILSFIQEDIPVDFFKPVKPDHSIQQQKNTKKKQMTKVPQNIQLLLKKNIYILHQQFTKTHAQFVESNIQIFIDPNKANFAIDTEKQVKFFCPQSSSGFYFCNYGNLLFSKNKKNLAKTSKITEFIEKFNEWSEKIRQNIFEEEYFPEFQHSGYLVFKNKNAKKKPILTNKDKMDVEKPNKKIKKQENNENKTIQTQTVFSWDHIQIGELSIHIMPSAFDPTDFSLYERYQAAVHNQFNESETGYQNFLCKSTISPETVETCEPCDKQFQPIWDSEGKTKVKYKLDGYRYKTMGCYHMKYFLRGKLIAVNFIDILPSLMISNYFMYQPILKNYNIAVFSAILDIEYVRFMSLSFPQFRYYSLSYYIQGNSKLEYKNQYRPFQILCPKTKRWLTFTPQVKQKISKIIKGQHQCVLSNEQPIEDVVFPANCKELDNYFNSIVKFPQNKLFQHSFQFTDHCIKLQSNFRGYIKSLGKQLASIIKFIVPDQLFQKEKKENQALEQHNAQMEIKNQQKIEEQNADGEKKVQKQQGS